jgi:hypothetical protein
MTLSRFFLLVCCAVLGVSTLAQTTTLPDLDQGRLWVSPLAVLTTGIHAGYILEEPSAWLGFGGVRVEANVWDRKARLYALWRTDRSELGFEQSFREVGLGVANLGGLGSRNTALKSTVGGPSAYVAWGHTRRTLEWQRGRGKGTMPMTVMWGIRAEWLSRRVTVGAPNGNTQEFNLGLFLPVFARLQLPIG